MEKNIIRHLTLILLFLLLLSTNAFSQDEPWRLKAISETGKMQQQLGLDSTQTTKLLDLNIYYARKLDSIVRLPVAYDTIKVLSKRFQTYKSKKTKQILTGSQWSQYKRDKAAQRQRMSQRRPGHYPLNDVDN